MKEDMSIGLRLKRSLYGLLGGNPSSLDTRLLRAKTTNEQRMALMLGANVNSSFCGETALMRAETAEQTKFLLKAGANVYYHDDMGKTALMCAKTAEQTKLLLEAGAGDKGCIDSVDLSGKTALMYAETAEQTKLLLKAGANVYYHDDMGKTALMCAKTAEQTKLLLEAGADVNAKDNEGKTALDYAKTDEQCDLLRNAMKKAKEKEFAFNEARERNIAKAQQLCKIISEQYSNEKVSDVIMNDKNSGKEKNKHTQKVEKEVRKRIIDRQSVEI